MKTKNVIENLDLRIGYNPAIERKDETNMQLENKEDYESSPLEQIAFLGAAIGPFIRGAYVAVAEKKGMNPQLDMDFMIVAAMPYLPAVASIFDGKKNKEKISDEAIIGAMSAAPVFFMPGVYGVTTYIMGYGIATMMRN